MSAGFAPIKDKDDEESIVLCGEEQRSVLGDISVNSLPVKKPRRRSSRIAAKANDDDKVENTESSDAPNEVIPLKRIAIQEEDNGRKRKRTRSSSKKKLKSKRSFKRSKTLPTDSQAITTKSPRFVQSFLPPGSTPQQGFELQSSFNLSPEQYDPSKFTANNSPLDERAKGFVNYAPEYASDIFQWLYFRENETTASPYLESSLEYVFNTMVRTLLVDWMIETTTKMRTNPETVHLAVNIFDRYLSLVDAENRKTLYLVAVTALFLAYKYEEVYPLEVADCIRLTRRGFTRQQILDMEVDILSTLQFSLNTATSYKFMKRFLYITMANKTMKYAAMYYLEKALLKHDALEYRPSLLAAGACCLAINHPELALIEEGQPGVPQDLLDYTSYDFSQIYDAAQFVADNVSETVIMKGFKRLSSAEKKYSTSRYHKVSSYSVPDALDLLEA